jgi:hypothetical protein
LAARRSRSTPPPAELPPQLTVARDWLGAELDIRIFRGNELLEREISSEDDLRSAQNDYYTWDEYNHCCNALSPAPSLLTTTEGLSSRSAAATSCCSSRSRSSTTICRTRYVGLPR